jgi:hypothetical protein
MPPGVLITVPLPPPDVVTVSVKGWLFVGGGDCNPLQPARNKVAEHGEAREEQARKGLHQFPFSKPGFDERCSELVG